MEWIAYGAVVFQIMLFLWFIDTLGKIKVYLRDIHEIAERSERYW